MQYIKVILPLKLGWEPFYRTDGEDVEVGVRVSVRFAGRRYVGVVSEVGATPDLDISRIQPVDGVQKHLDRISGQELEFWRFLAEYYLCTVGEVYKLAYPAQKTAGEEVKARAEERQELMREKTAELYRRRLARLKERLAAKDAALSRKHNDKVTAELTAARDRIVAEMAAVSSRLDSIAASVQETPRLAPEAESAIKAGGRPVLLHGGPDRIDVIISQAHGTISAGRDVLLLVPDIALSTSLRIRLEGLFGDSLMVFHSKVTAGRRRAVAEALRKSDKPRLVLGTRSAIFLPFNNLGLIIVEEEHDTLYKHDGAPRFNTRDAAVVLGGIHGAQVILSSPTPSLESLLNCRNGRFTLLGLQSGRTDIEVVDTSVEARKRGMVGSLSRVLISHIAEELSGEGNVLVLRPWGPLDDLKDELAGVFPEASGRIALTTTYEARRKDISDVTLLAVIGTDALLDKQDFRADERLIQALEQFRGRFDGIMLVQTRQGEHPVYSHEGDYYEQLLAERNAVHYPPYSRMLDIIVRDTNQARLKKMSYELAAALRGFSPMGPYVPARGRTPEPDVQAIRIMLARDKSLPGRKKEIAGIVSDFESSRKYSGHIIIDVDPA